VGKQTEEADGIEKSNCEENLKKGNKEGGGSSGDSGLAMRNYWIEYFDTEARRWICESRASVLCSDY
jgi:hypothetical protein